MSAYYENKKDFTNPFRKIYDSEEYKNVNINKDNLRPFPFIVDIELTNNCNLNCLFCSRHIMKRKKGFMSFDTFKKFVDEMAENNSALRMIRWGEPLLHPELLEFVEYAKNKGVLVHITTNGLLLNEEKAKKLIELGLNSIIFSFQGATKKGYEEMRNNKKYDLLCENIKRFMAVRDKTKAKTWAHISSTMTNETDEEIASFKDEWLKVVDSVGIGKTNFARVEEKDIKKINNVVQKESIKRFYRPCTEVRQKISVNWNGDITACCADYDNELVVGNISKNSLKEAWNGKKIECIRYLLDGMNMGMFSLCKNCYHTYEEF